MIRPFLSGLLLLALLAGCADVGVPQPPAVARLQTMPPIKAFPHHAAPRTGRSNASTAREFMALAFRLESGRELPVLSRFEGPVTLRTTGAGISPVTERDIDNLLRRLHTEARIDISRVAADQPAGITVQFLSRATLKRAVPQAACFVAPGVSDWQEFLAKRNSPETDWTTVSQRERMAVFLPADVSAQEIRDCLHEEVAQALGPVNDLYHLKDSVFNDDNFHTILTGFDMLILRAFYDPALHSGMSPGTVAARLPGILTRINPRGATGYASHPSPTPLVWKQAIETALGADRPMSTRLSAIRRAVAIARLEGWNDVRLGFSLYAQGRVALSVEPELALASFAEADGVFRADPAMRVHSAHVAVQRAAYLLSSGRGQEAVGVVDQFSPVALAAENAALLSALLMIKAEALEWLGRTDEAAIVRLDSLGWARYGFGSQAVVRRRLQEIAALAPPSPQGS